MSRDLKDLPEGIPAPGTIFAGKCRIDRVIGIGGMGAVLAATHLHLKEQVAIKVMLPQLARNPEVVERFLREGRAAVRIRSPHVARVLDVATLDTGEPYMLMELLDGSDLGHLLTKAGRFDVRTAVDFVLDACEALAEAHRKNVIHRDLKPANLFLARQEDGREILKVLDFGISKIDDAQGEGMSITKSRSMLGSPLYMSPEQLKGSRDVDARADIWSLGVILYELVSGAPPFDAETVAELGALVLAGNAPKLEQVRPDVPSAFSQVVDKCLQKKREARYASVVELAEALAPFGSANRIEQTKRLRETSEASSRVTALSAPALSNNSDELASVPTLPARTGGVWSTTFSGAAPRKRIALAILAVFGLGVGGAAVFALTREPNHERVRPASPTVPSVSVSVSVPASAPRVEESADASAIDAPLVATAVTPAPVVEAVDAGSTKRPRKAAPSPRIVPKPTPPATPSAAPPESDRFK